MIKINSTHALAWSEKPVPNTRRASRSRRVCVGTSVQHQGAAWWNKTQYNYRCIQAQTPPCSLSSQHQMSAFMQKKGALWQAVTNLTFLFDVMLRMRKES